MKSKLFRRPTALSRGAHLSPEGHLSSRAAALSALLPLLGRGLGGGLLLLFAVFAACSSDKDDAANATPAKAVVAGTEANVCPNASVTLVAAAENAASYQWYNGAMAIPGATGANYEVTVTGIYAVAGVNAAGEGAKSDAKSVAISPCAKAPAKASVSGSNANTCPALTVALTASAASATSYQWYNGTSAIPGATSAGYEVTASGTYYAAGVNAVGEGEKSDAKPVEINTCGTYSDLLGAYNASATPSWFDEPGPSAWTSNITQPAGGYNSSYTVSNFGNNSAIAIPIFYNNGVLTLDIAKVGGNDTYDAYLIMLYSDGEDGDGNKQYRILEYAHEIHWNASTGVLDMSGTKNGDAILIGIAAVTPSTGDIAGFFSDCYAGLQYTKKTSSGSPGAHAAVVNTTPIPGTALRTLEGLQGGNIKGRIHKN
jgi:hypothetical protein